MIETNDLKASLVEELSELDATNPEPEATDGGDPDPGVGEGDGAEGGDGQETETEASGEEADPAPVPPTPDPAPVPPTPDPAPKPDAEVQKKLDLFQRREKQLRLEWQKKEQEFQQREAAINEQAQALQRFQEAQANFALDPVPYLEMMGYKPEQFEDLAKAIYYAGKGAKDPQVKAAYDQHAQVRRAMQEAQKAMQAAQDLQRRLDEERQSWQAQQQVEAYLTSVQNAVSDQTPLTKNWVTSDPAEARLALRQAAEYIGQQTGEIPQPGEVVQKVEELLLARAKKWGLTKQQTQSAKSKQAKTLTNDLGSSSAPSGASEDREAERRRVLQALQQGRLD